MNLETRQFVTSELRFEQDGTLTGYIARFNSPSKDLGFIETLAPGCFYRSLTTGNDIVALINHDSNAPIGRTSNGTLQLREDNSGLAYSITLPNTSRANDLRELVKSGVVSGCSFGFIADDDTWGTNSAGYPTRTINACTLREVSVGVTFPAYNQTSSKLRALPESMPAEIRSMLDADTDDMDTDTDCTCQCAACLSGDCSDCGCEDCDCDNCDCLDDDATRSLSKPTEDEKKYIQNKPGNKNSKGESAPWVIVQKGTGKIISSFKTKDEAYAQFTNMVAAKYGTNSEDISKLEARFAQVRLHMLERESTYSSGINTAVSKP